MKLGWSRHLVGLGLAPLGSRLYSQFTLGSLGLAPSFRYPPGRDVEGGLASFPSGLPSEGRTRGWVEQFRCWYAFALYSYIRLHLARSLGGCSRLDLVYPLGVVWLLTASEAGGTGFLWVSMAISHFTVYLISLGSTEVWSLLFILGQGALGLYFRGPASSGRGS